MRLLIKSHLQLAHYSMAIVLDECIICHVGTLVNILHLNTALLVEPILKSSYRLVLVHSQGCIKAPAWVYPGVWHLSDSRPCLPHRRRYPPGIRREP